MTKRAFALLALLLSLGGCPTPGPDFTGPPPTTGWLYVSVIAPDGIQTRVVVAGPGGYASPVAANMTLNNLVPGDYTVGASNVNGSTTTYVPTPAVQVIPVAAGNGGSATVFYCSIICPWTPKAAMTTPLLDATAGVVGGKFFALGHTAHDPMTTVESYDPATDAWTVVGRGGLARSDGRTAVVNGIIYQLAGVDSLYASVTQIDVYDPQANTWSVAAPFPAPRFLYAAGVVNGVLYVVGGHDSGITDLSSVLAYDPATDSWSTRAPLHTPRSGAGVGAFNGSLYAAGGQNGQAYLSTVEAYDPVADAWTVTPALPQTTWAPGVIDINGTLYILRDSGSTVLRFDPNTNHWIAVQPIPPNVSGSAIGVIGSVLWAVRTDGGGGAEEFVP